MSVVVVEIHHHHIHRTRRVLKLKRNHNHERIRTENDSILHYCMYAECCTPNGYVGGITRHRHRNSNGFRTNLCTVSLDAFSLVYALIYIFHSLFIICKQILESYLKGVLFTISPYTGILIVWKNL